MQRKFLTNLAFLVLLNLLIKPFWIFGIDRSVQNAVGSQEFGFYFTLINFAFLFNILLDLGVTTFNNRNIAQHAVLLKKHFSGIITLKLLLSVVYFVVTFGVAFLIGYRGRHLTLLFLVGFNQFLISLIMYFRSNISGLLMLRTESLMSVMDRILMIGIMSVLLWGNITTEPFKIDWFVYIQTIAYGLVALIGFLIVAFKAKFQRLSWNPLFFLMILKKSAPFALLVLLMTLYHRIDSVIIERLLPFEVGETQVGIYAHAFRILDAANQFSNLFAVLLFPVFSKMIQDKQPLLKMIQMPLSMLFAFSIILTIGSTFYSTEIMNLLYKDYIEASSNVFSILIFGSIAVAISYIFGTLLTANGNLKTLIGIAAFSMLVSLSVNIILVPSYGALGSAIANVSALFSSMILHAYFAIRKLHLKFTTFFFVRMILFAVAVFSMGYFLKELPYSWLFNLGLFVASSLILAFSIRLISLKEVFQILNNQE